MSPRLHSIWCVALRLAVAAATAWTLYLLGGYFLHYRDVRRHHLESALFIVAGLGSAALWAHSSEEEWDPIDRWPSSWLIWASALIAATVLYWPALQIGFLSDDFVLAERARQGEFVARTHEFVRPVPLMVWRMLLLSGAGARTIHSVNIALHAANSVLTAGVARAVGLNRTAALIAGLLFLVWPTQVESVTWASGVFDVLMTTLVLLLATTYLRVSHSFSYSRWAGLIAVTVLALSTKETAAAIPALLLLISIRQRRRPTNPSRVHLTEFAAVTSVCCMYAIWRVFLRDPMITGQHPPITSYVLKEWVSRTFASLAVPFTDQWIQGAALLVAMFSAFIVLLSVAPIVGGQKAGSRRHLVFVALAWPLLATAPAVGYLFIGSQLEGSRYLYLPMTGWAIFLAMSADTVDQLSRRCRLVLSVCALLGIGLLAAQTRSLLRDWQTAASLRDAILREAVRSADVGGCRTAHFAQAPERYKGAQLFNNGLDEAVAEFRTTVLVDRENLEVCQFIWIADRFVRRQSNAELLNR